MLRLPPLLLLAPLAAACTDYATLCSRNDPSVTAEGCWDAGYDDGFTTASHDAYDAAYDEGYAACESDYAATL